MIESFQEVSIRQNRRDMIRSYLFQNKNKQKKDKMQNTKQQDLVESLNLQTLQAQIKQFKYQQAQSYPSLKLYESAFCSYNTQRKALFLCCHQQCDKHAFICGDQECKCVSDHKKCAFTAIDSFLDHITSKLSQQISNQIQNYFQVKSIIYEHILNRISQERQALADWQQEINIRSEKFLLLYGFNKEQVILCHAPKLVYQQKLEGHQKCGCIPLKIQEIILDDQYENIKNICNRIHKTYSSIINYIDQKVDQLQYHKECSNLNIGQFLLVDFLKNKNYFCMSDYEHEEFDLSKGSKKKNIVPGNAIYLARKCNKDQSKNIDLEKFNVNRIRKVWKNYSERQFRLFVEGKAVNQLFYRVKNAKYLPIHQFSQFRSYMVKIIQSLSIGQQYLFSKDYKKPKYLTNIEPAQLKKELQKQKGTNYDQVYIWNDKYDSAVNGIETIKALGKLRNVRKLQIKWCQLMKVSVSMQILSTMPHLKHLALLHHTQKQPQNFIKKLAQFKQLESFYINYHSNSQHYRAYCQDQWFIGFEDLKKVNLPSIEEIIELSKLPNLTNIEIFHTNNANSAQAIKNIKSLKYLTLGYDCYSNQQLDLLLMDEVIQQRQLRTLSLIGVKVLHTKQVDDVIINNPHLSTIIIRNGGYNKNINDDTVQFMGDLIQLQALCISSNISITGKHLAKLDSLIMLELQNCKKINKYFLKEALTNMQKLQHLNLNDNSWVDDEILMSVQSCKQLRYLNIYDTQASGMGLKYLDGLTSLRILICGKSMINGKDLIDFTKQVTSIKRLSIYLLKVDDNDLLEINENCQEITHLNARDTKITLEGVLKVKSLKVVRIGGLDRACKKKLKQANIKLYAF